MNMKCRGSMLVEVAVAAAVLSGAVAVCVELLGAAITQRRANADRQLAAQEAANLMERVAAIPLGELRPEKVKDWEVSAEGKQLRGVRSEVEIGQPDGEPKGIRVRVSVRWEDRNGTELPPMRLIAWRYR